MQFLLHLRVDGDGVGDFRFDQLAKAFSQAMEATFTAPSRHRGVVPHPLGKANPPPEEPGFEGFEIDAAAALDDSAASVSKARRRESRPIHGRRRHPKAARPGRPIWSGTVVVCPAACSLMETRVCPPPRFAARL